GRAFFWHCFAPPAGYHRVQLHPSSSAMTHQTPSGRRAAARSDALRPAARQALVAVSAVLLAACSSTPLPPWPDQPPATGPRPARVVPPPLGTVAPPTDTGAAPVTVTPVQPVEPLPAQPAPAPLSPLDARFAEPPMRYETPGLAEGRRAPTPHAEA